VIDPSPQPSEIRLAVIGDVHARMRTLDTVIEHLADTTLHGVLLVGDLGSMLPRARAPKPGERRRYLRTVRGVLERAASLGVPLAWVPGNHDLPDLDLPGNADRRVVDVAGLRVLGLGGSPDHRKDPYEYEEDEIRALDLPESDVILSHTPPARTPLDRVPRRDAHVGSEAVRELAESRSGALVCGHIHESPGACLLGRTVCLNAGGLGRPYGKAQVGWLVWRSTGVIAGHADLESGEERWWWYDDEGLELCGMVSP